MTIAELFGANRKIYGLVLLLFGVLGWLLYAFVTPTSAACLGLALTAVILRDIGYFRRSVMIWPTLEQVLDWNRVEQLAGGAETKSERTTDPTGSV